MSEGKRRMSCGELGCGFVLLLILVVVFLPALNRPHRVIPLRAQCQNNLRQFGLVFKMYAMESRGELYPPMFVAGVHLYDCTDADDEFVLSVQQGRATPSSEAHGVAIAAPLVSAIYPEYLSDPTVFICPSDLTYTREEFTTRDDTNYFAVNCVEPRLGAKSAGNSYAYTGFAYYGGDDRTREPAQLAAVLGGISAAVERNDWATATKLASGDFAVPSTLAAATASEAKVPRLREGIERFFISDQNDSKAVAKVQSKIWVMQDRLRITGILAEFNHLPGGSNVLFLDGHVEFVRYVSEDETAPPVTAACSAAYALLGD